MSKWQKKPDSPPRDHYQEVTDKVLAELERGVVPWRKPWDSDIAAPSAMRNAVTGHKYRGINTLILGMSPHAFGSSDPRWCSYKQATEKGWQVRKGEKSTSVMFFKMFDPKHGENSDPDDDRKIPILRSFPIFHASQIEGIPTYVPPTAGEVTWRSPEAVDIIMKNSGATLKFGGDRAFYSPGTDHIQLPPIESFGGPEQYASTALHELGHWTGADKPGRLNRNLTGRFGSKSYADEELVAELCSVYTASEIGIAPDLRQHASYLDSWATRLKEDKKAIFRAASQAQLAADLCLSFHPDYALKLKADRAAEAAETAPDAEPKQPSPSVLKAAELAREHPDQYKSLPEHLRRQADDYMRTVDPALAAAALERGRQSPSRTSAPAPRM